MKALNLSGGKHLPAATMFWPYADSCSLQPSSKGREIRRSREKQRRAEGFSGIWSSTSAKPPSQKSNLLKLDNNAKRPIRSWHGPRVITRLIRVYVIITHPNGQINHLDDTNWDVWKAALTELFRNSFGGPTWCNVWAQKKDTALNQQLLHH